MNYLKYLKRLLFSLTALLLPSLAFAESYIGGSGHIWEFPAFGNAYVISEMLKGIALVAQDGEYRSILLVVSAAGFLLIGLTGLADAGTMIKKVLTYIFGLFFVLYVCGVSGSSSRLLVNVAVYDVTNPATRIVVQDVPGFIAWPQIFIYSVGHSITKTLEKNMGGPEYAGLSKGSPFNLSAQLMADAQKIEVSDPNLKASLSEYTTNCVMPMLANGQLQMAELLTAPDLMAAMRIDNNVLAAPVYPKQLDANTGLLQQTLPCDQAWRSANDRLNALYSATNMDKHLRAIGSFAGTPLGTPLTALADQALLYSTNSAAGSSADLIKQNAMSKVLEAARANGVGLTDGASIMSSTQIELAHQSQLSSWESGLAIFSKTAGYMFSVLQAFLIAAMPVFILLLVVPGLAGKMVVNLVKITVWLALWEPLLAIISFVTAAYLQQEVTTLTSTTGNPFTSLQLAGLVTAKAHTMVLAAGFLATSMPMLIWGIVSGTFAFTEFISHGVGSSFANSAGQGIASGNLAMNNVSQANRSANAHSVAFSHNGEWGSISNSMSMSPGAPGGMGNAQGSTGFQITKTRGTSEQISSAKEAASSAAKGLSGAHDQTMQSQKAIASVLSSAIATSNGHNTSTGVTTDGGWSKESRDQWTTATAGALAKAQAEAAGHGSSTTINEQAGIALDKLAEGFGLTKTGAGQYSGAPGDMKKFKTYAGTVGSAIGAGISISGDTGTSANVQITDTHSQTKSGDHNVAASTGQNLRKSGTHSDTNTTGVTATGTKSNSTTETALSAALTKYTEDARKEDSARETLSRMQSAVQTLSGTETLNVSKADYLAYQQQQAADQSNLGAPLAGRMREVNTDAGTVIGDAKAATPAPAINPKGSNGEVPANVQKPGLNNQVAALQNNANAAIDKTQKVNENTTNGLLQPGKPTVDGAKELGKNQHLSVTDIDPVVHGAVVGATVAKGVTTLVENGANVAETALLARAAVPAATVAAGAAPAAAAATPWLVAGGAVVGAGAAGYAVGTGINYGINYGMEAATNGKYNSFGAYLYDQVNPSKPSDYQVDPNEVAALKAKRNIN